MNKFPPPEKNRVFYRKTVFFHRIGEITFIFTTARRSRSENKIQGRKVVRILGLTDFADFLLRSWGIIKMCTPLLPKMHTPRPFVKRCYGRKWKKLCGNRFRSTAEPYIVKKYRKSLANQGLCKKKLDTNQDTHCIKIGVQLWWRQGDSNPRPHGCEPCALTGWAMPPSSGICRTLSLYINRCEM